MLVRRLRGVEHPTVVVFYFALVSAILSIPATLLNFVLPTWTELLVLLAIGITTQLGQVSITRGLAREPAGKASAIGYLQIVFAAIWSAFVFSQLPDLGTICGAVIIIVSTYFIVKRPAPKNEVARTF